MRLCPFHHCERKIPESVFACRSHWFCLKKPERDRVWEAYHAYMRDELTIEELRVIQQEVLGDRGTA